MNSSLAPLYNRLPIQFSRGDGVWLWDNHQQQYLDTFAGIGVCNLGHSHPAITKAIQQQASQLLHVSNGADIIEQTQLADTLTHVAAMQQAYFCNSGAEANETAIKIARRYGHQRGIDTPCILVMEKSFHGRTMATLSATGSRAIQAGFEPLVQGFIRSPFDDIETLQAIAQHNTNIVAILVEPILGNGGVVLPQDTYLTQLRKICDQHDWLLMVDEIQTGVGRTGKWYAYQHENITPDVVTTAKALANGIPIGACLMSGKALNVLDVGSHGCTFGGNPFVSRVATTVLDTMQQDHILKNAQQQGNYLLQQLHNQLNTHPLVKTIRGKGLMIGIELTAPIADLRKKALNHKLFINVTATKVIRLLPALTITQSECDHIVSRVTTLLDTCK